MVHKAFSKRATRGFKLSHWRQRAQNDNLAFSCCSDL